MSSTMRLYEIRNWLKTLNLFEHYYIGKLDQKPDKAIGVYQLSTSGSPITSMLINCTFQSPIVGCFAFMIVSKSVFDASSVSLALLFQ